MKLPPKVNTHVVDVNGVTVKLQSKPDNEAVNGWAVICYAPDMSIRSKCLHNVSKREKFILSIGLAAGYELHELGGEVAEEDIASLEKAVHILTPTITPPA